ncbi:hypothetical protein BRC81_15665 [Halobacteriales archaeon QS_1_68_20]|nr:MAG: hypothetical protein BRC81_15665 [Halobacteriales archaeon QS_1_68_20]
MIGVVVSRADSASEHLGDHLLDLREWAERTDEARPDAAGGGSVYRSDPFELRTFEELHLHLDGVPEAFGHVNADSETDEEVDLVVFASRHSGETGPLLTAHFTGNFGPAEFGGADGELAEAAPAALEAVVAAFDEYAPEGYDAGVECTHHGPSDVGAPSLFVELGSDEPQWEDPEGARAVARSILALEALAGNEGIRTGDERTVVGFGGGHYAPRFERVLRETDWSVGHVAADWALDAMGDPETARDAVGQAFERSGATHACLDGEDADLRAVVEELGYRTVSETWIREVDGVPLALADAVEDAICTVDSGLRFGDLATRGAVEPDDVTVVSLPDELLDEAGAVDAEGTLNAVRETTVAYETEENGNRPRGEAAVRGEGDRETLVDRLVSILAEEYESVGREGDAVVVTERAFAPERARELGVPEGPKFGALADGKPVEVEGETVSPKSVTEERTRRLRVY